MNQILRKLIISSCHLGCELKGVCGVCLSVFILRVLRPPFLQWGAQGLGKGEAGVWGPLMPVALARPWLVGPSVHAAPGRLPRAARRPDSPATPVGTSRANSPVVTCRVELASDSQEVAKNRAEKGCAHFTHPPHDVILHLPRALSKSGNWHNLINSDTSLMQTSPGVLFLLFLKIYLFI